MAKKSFDYFEAFEKLSALAVQEADILIEAIDNFTSAEEVHEVFERAHVIENQGDVINHELFEAVAVEFITPIEREDIIELAQNLDNILDDIEDVILCFYMYNVQEVNANARAFAGVIRNGCEALHNAMLEFRNYKKVPPALTEGIVKVNDFEEEGDRLLMDAMHELFTQRTDQPVYLQTWAYLYNRLEKCCDATEHAANVVSTILLKNS